MAVTFLCPKCREPQPCGAHGKNGRGTSYQRGYGGKRWLKFRLWFLANNPLCSGKWSRCEKNGIITAAKDVDHDRPVTGRDDPNFYAGPFNALCSKCHRAKT